MSDDLNRTIEVIKEGLPIDPHEHEWFECLTETTEAAWTTERICRTCGRMEKTTELRNTETFESIYEKFHGGEK